MLTCHQFQWLVYTERLSITGLVIDIGTLNSECETLNTLEKIFIYKYVKNHKILPVR